MTIESGYRVLGNTGSFGLEIRKTIDAKERNSLLDEFQTSSPRSDKRSAS